MQAAIPSAAGHVYGLDSSLINFELMGGCGLHRDVIAPVKQLQQQAHGMGFELAIASGYRDFERQLLIWNAKARGERPVLDSDGQALDIATLDPWQQVQAILRWSALPGASRHHWGTDIDVYDRAVMPADYQLQLTTEETVTGGLFAPFHQWLDEYLKMGEMQGFFRPYRVDQGGIAPERWHLSYAPLSSEYEQAFNLDDLITIIEVQPMVLKEAVLENIDDIFQRYIRVPTESDHPV